MSEKTNADFLSITLTLVLERHFSGLAEGFLALELL